MQIFDRDGRGAEEIVRAVGLIANDVTYDKWEPLLPLGIKDVSAIIGIEPVRELCALYMDPDSDPAYSRAVQLLQQATAMMTWLKMIPTLDAQHDSAGRGRRIGENEKGLTALEQWKDEENIRRLGYEAVDALVEQLETLQPVWWVHSSRCRMRRSLLLPDKATFDDYYVIGSHRLYITLLPIIRETQCADIEPVTGAALLARILTGDDELGAIADTARRALALLTMKRAIERLPVSVIPDGIVQTQYTQPVHSKVKADREARQAVAQSLGADAARALQRLADLVAALDGDEPDELYVSRPIVHSKGMSF